MQDLLVETKKNRCELILNRYKKSNAFDNVLLTQLKKEIDNAIANPSIDIIVLKATGRHFSAGADLAWMQKIIQHTEKENIADVQILSDVLETLYFCPKITVAIVQGNAYGGGLGLIAACDIAIASEHAKFCFSEVKLGLIPAIISPYIIKAIGERQATWLFTSTELIDAARAQAINLIQYCITNNQLDDFTHDYLTKLAQLPHEAQREAKAIVRHVGTQAINPDLKQWTIHKIAKKRVSKEAQLHLTQFLTKE